VLWHHKLTKSTDFTQFFGHPFPFFVKLILHFLAKLKKRRINFTKREDIRERSFELIFGLAKAYGECKHLA
jgi:hypothetical protein